MGGWEIGEDVGRWELGKWERRWRGRNRVGGGGWVDYLRWGDIEGGGIWGGIP